MIPLRDDVPSRTVPLVNYTLIALNVFAFLLELGMGRDVQRFLQQTAVVPGLFTGADGALQVAEVVTTSFDPALGGRVLLSMFLHGGWAHLLGNMLYLWIFGDNVEDRMGHVRYAVFYLLCGWAATYAHIAAAPASALPALGASGAIAGVLGAYVTLYPRARVITLLPLFIFVQLIQVPAYFFLGLWFLQQFLYGTLSLARTAQTEGGGVAWWAHIGGFAAGFLLVWLFQSRKRAPRQRDAWWENQYRGRRVRGW
jgi:membrane associated rhomboid family serine protease